MDTDIARRVHIAPLGLERDRITKPAIEMRADQVVLVDFLPTAYSDRLLADEIEADLTEAGITSHRERVEIEDLYDAVEAFGALLVRYADDRTYVNLSTGEEVTTIGATIACMTTGLGEPYHVEADRHGTLHSPVPEDVAAIDTLPPYPMDRPSRDELSVMEYIASEDPVDRAALIRFGHEHDLGFVVDAETPALEDGEPTKAGYMRLKSRITDPLEDQDYITVEEVGREDRITLTDRGANILRAFRHVIEASEDADGEDTAMGDAR